MSEHADDHDEKILAIFEALHQMMNPEAKTTKQIGFRVKAQSAH